MDDRRPDGVWPVVRAASAPASAPVSARARYRRLLSRARPLGAFHATHVLMYGVTRFIEGDARWPGAGFARPRLELVRQRGHEADGRSRGERIGRANAFRGQASAMRPDATRGKPT